MFAGGFARFRRGRHICKMVSMYTDESNAMGRYVLCGINKETPPKDIEEDEEHRGVQPSSVSRIEKFGGECAQENDAGSAADGADEHKQPAAEAVNGQGGDGVAEDGEGGPAGVEEEGVEAREAEGGVDEDAVVGHHEDAQELVAPHQQEGDEGTFAIGHSAEHLQKPACQLGVLLELFGHEVVLFAGVDVFGVSRGVVQVLDDVEGFGFTASGEEPARGVGDLVASS